MTHNVERGATPFNPRSARNYTRERAQIARGATPFDLRRVRNNTREDAI